MRSECKILILFLKFIFQYNSADLVGVLNEYVKYSTFYLRKLNINILALSLKFVIILAMSTSLWMTLCFVSKNVLTFTILHVVVIVRHTYIHLYN